MKRVLVVYATGSGCTADIAGEVARTLQAPRVAVDLWPAPADPDPAPYDAVVAGSGVRRGRWHQSLETWVEECAGVLRQRPIAFFSVCLTMATHPERAAEVRAYTQALVARTGVAPLDVGTFAGWNEPKRFGLLERGHLKRLEAPVGDFRDLDAVHTWSRQIAPKLGVAAPTWLTPPTGPAETTVAARIRPASRASS
jgi:menaquinone-dependent protoporphyrinogen oxidase